jgi:hypothetical protein
MKNEECLPSPAAFPGEGERRIVSFKTTLFCSAQNSGPFFLTYIYIYILFLLILFVGYPKMGYSRLVDIVVLTQNLHFYVVEMYA